MLAQRLRRWPNIKPTLFQCVVFAGNPVEPIQLEKLYHCTFHSGRSFRSVIGFNRVSDYNIQIYKLPPTVLSELRTHSRGLLVFILFKQKLSSLYLFVILEAREHLGKYFELHFIQTVIISVMISFFSTKLIILGRTSSYLKHIQCTVSHKPENECVYSWKRLSDRITIMNTCAAVSQQITNC